MGAWVYVKLNEYGTQVLRDGYDRLHEDFKSRFEYRPPKVDEDGYTKMQLWSVMSSFGAWCGLGMTPPFDTEIKLGGK